MASNKSRVKSQRAALEPRRRPGKERVAALMEAAASVIAEKGYEAATMAEIAARAGALVGSLYHFFPSKEALAEALIRRYEGIVDDAFARIDERAASMSVEELANALIGLMIGIQVESRAMVALLEARADWSAKRREFMDNSLRRIAKTLTLKSPALDAESALSIAVVLLQNMKAMKALVAEYGEASGAVAELREMTQVYLANKFRG
jgi:AcrR family transcriptional regulator